MAQTKSRAQLEARYNDLLEKRDRLRDEIIDAKRELDAVNDQERMRGVLADLGLGGKRAEAMIETLTADVAGMDAETEESDGK